MALRFASGNRTTIAPVQVANTPQHRVFAGLSSYSLAYRFKFSALNDDSREHTILQVTRGSGNDFALMRDDDAGGETFRATIRGLDEAGSAVVLNPQFTLTDVDTWHTVIISVDNESGDAVLRVFVQVDGGSMTQVATQTAAGKKCFLEPLEGQQIGFYFDSTANYDSVGDLDVADFVAVSPALSSGDRSNLDINADWSAVDLSGYDLWNHIDLNQSDSSANPFDDTDAGLDNRNTEYWGETADSGAVSMTIDATADTITRNDAGSFTSDGFAAGQWISIEGTSSNNTVTTNPGFAYRIASLTATVITLDSVSDVGRLADETSATARLRTLGGIGNLSASTNGFQGWHGNANFKSWVDDSPIASATSTYEVAANGKQFKATIVGGAGMTTGDLDWNGFPILTVESTGYTESGGTRSSGTHQRTVSLRNAAVRTSVADSGSDLIVTLDLTDEITDSDTITACSLGAGWLTGESASTPTVTNNSAIVAPIVNLDVVSIPHQTYRDATFDVEAFAWHAPSLKHGQPVVVEFTVTDGTNTETIAVDSYTLVDRINSNGGTAQVPYFVATFTTADFDDGEITISVTAYPGCNGVTSATYSETALASSGGSVPNLRVYLDTTHSATMTISGGTPEAGSCWRTTDGTKHLMFIEDEGGGTYCFQQLRYSDAIADTDQFIRADGGGGLIEITSTPTANASGTPAVVDIASVGESHTVEAYGDVQSAAAALAAAYETQWNTNFGSLPSAEQGDGSEIRMVRGADLWGRTNSGTAIAGYSAAWTFKGSDPTKCFIYGTRSGKAHSNGSTETFIHVEDITVTLVPALRYGGNIVGTANATATGTTIDLNETVDLSGVVLSGDDSVQRRWYIWINDGSGTDGIGQTLQITAVDDANDEVTVGSSPTISGGSAPWQLFSTVNYNQFGTVGPLGDLASPMYGGSDVGGSSFIFKNVTFTSVAADDDTYRGRYGSGSIGFVDTNGGRQWFFGCKQENFYEMYRNALVVRDCTAERCDQQTCTGSKFIANFNVVDLDFDRRIGAHGDIAESLWICDRSDPWTVTPESTYNSNLSTHRYGFITHYLNQALDIKAIGVSMGERRFENMGFIGCVYSQNSGESGALIDLDASSGSPVYGSCQHLLMVNNTFIGNSVNVRGAITDTGHDCTNWWLARNAMNYAGSKTGANYDEWTAWFQDNHVVTLSGATTLGLDLTTGGTLGALFVTDPTDSDSLGDYAAAIGGTLTSRHDTADDYLPVGISGLPYSGTIGAYSSAFAAPGTAGDKMTPGSGWAGASTFPAANGDSGADQYDKTAIGRWTGVIRETFTGTTSVGVIADHYGGIDYVAFAVEGSSWVSIATPTTNPATGDIEYWVRLDAADYSDGPVEVRALIVPTAGQTRMLQGSITADSVFVDEGEHSMFLNANSGGTLFAGEAWVDSTAGDDANDGSEGSPVATIRRAVEVLGDSNGGDAGGGTVYLEGGNHLWGGTGDLMSTATSWVTIQPVAGKTRSDVVITGRGANTPTALKTEHVRLYNLTIEPTTENEAPIVTASAANGSALWVDNCLIQGAGNNYAGIGGTFNVGVWYTDCRVDQIRNGVRSAALVRGTDVTFCSEDVFTNCGIVSQSRTRKSLDLGGAHPDVIAYSLGVENRILSGVEASLLEDSQGLFLNQCTDMLFRDVMIDVETNVSPAGNAFHFGSKEPGALMSHIVIRDCQFVGGALIRDDSEAGHSPPWIDADAMIDGWLIENTVFTGGANGRPATGTDNYDDVITYTNTPPTDTTAPSALVNNEETIPAGGQTTASRENLEFTDDFQPPAHVTYTITTPASNTTVERTDNPGTPITTWTQQDINDEQIVFVNDGTPIADSMTVSVEDGETNVITNQDIRLNSTPITRGSLLLNGTDQLVQFALDGASNTIPDGSNVTLHARLYLRANPSETDYAMSISVDDTDTDYVGIRIDSTRQLTTRYQETSAGGTTYETGEILQTHRWYDITLVIEHATDLRYYIDGVRVGASHTPDALDWSDISGADGPNGGLVTLGALGRSSNSSHLPCRVSHATIWRTDLSDAQIESIAEGTDPATIQQDDIHFHADLADTHEDWATGGNGSGKSGLNFLASGTPSLVGSPGFTDYHCYPYLHPSSGALAEGDSLGWETTELHNGLGGEGGGLTFTLDAEAWVAANLIHASGTYTLSAATFYGPNGERVATDAFDPGMQSMENLFGSAGQSPNGCKLNRFDSTSPFVKLAAGQWSMHAGGTTTIATRGVDVFRGNGNKPPADARPAAFQGPRQVVFNGETITAYTDGRSGQHYLYNETTDTTIKLDAEEREDDGDKYHNALGLVVVGSRLCAWVSAHSFTSVYLLSATTFAGMENATPVDIAAISDGITGAANSITYGWLLADPNDSGTLWVYPRATALGTRIWKISDIDTSPLTPTVEGWVITQSSTVRHYPLAPKILTGTTNASGFVIALPMQHRYDADDNWSSVGVCFFDPDAEQCYDADGVLLGGGSATGKNTSTDPLVTSAQRDAVVGAVGGGMMLETPPTGDNQIMVPGIDVRLAETGLAPASSKLQCCAIAVQSDGVFHNEYGDSYVRLIVSDGATVVKSGATDDPFGLGVQTSYRVDGLVRWSENAIQAVIMPRDDRRVPNTSSPGTFPDSTYTPVYYDFNGARMVKAVVADALAATNASELEASVTVVSSTLATSLGAAATRKDNVTVEGTNQPAHGIGAPMAIDLVDGGSNTFMYYVATGGGRTRQIVDIKTDQFPTLSSSGIRGRGASKRGHSARIRRIQR